MHPARQAIASSTAFRGIEDTEHKIVTAHHANVHTFMSDRHLS